MLGIDSLLLENMTESVLCKLKIRVKQFLASCALGSIFVPTFVQCRPFGPQAREMAVLCVFVVVLIVATRRMQYGMAEFS
jgi:hypothetical protein